jgi:hypothetical protein
MKKYFVLIVILMLVAGTSCQENVDIEKEKKAIIAVIEEETDAAISGDYDRWANTYLQDETNVRLSANSAGYNLIVGWEDLDTYFKEAFENRDEQGPAWKGVKTNYRIKVYGNAAWVMCDEKAVNAETGEEMDWTAIECRILEKVDGEWKIVLLSFVTTSTYDDDVEEAGDEDEGDHEDDDDDDEASETEEVE